MGDESIVACRRNERRAWRSARAAAARSSIMLLALSCLSPPEPGLGQTSLVGVVADRETAAPLGGVYVALEARDGAEPITASLTDESGRFVLLAEPGGTYRIRAERVGLATEVTDWFTFQEGTSPRRIFLAERAVELEGLSVSAAVRTCRLDPAEATVVQRWWDEVRKALQATALREASELGELRFERFEREWTPNLRGLLAERTLPEDTTQSRPFLSQDAATLSERGFVQGVEGERWFLAPDAAVLFSEIFLTDHCLGIAGEGDDVLDTDPLPGELRLAVEPTRLATPDIRGVLTVDTLSGELRAFDYRYVNLPEELPPGEAGGHLAFEYLPSGAWIVSDWWIRMPRMGYEAAWMGMGRRPVLLGYVDRGGRVVEIHGATAELDARVGTGTVHGVVYDSLAGRPLAGARVSVMGSRLVTRTDPDGRFTLDRVPAGRHGVTFHDEELTRLGLPSPVAVVQVMPGVTDSVRLTTPALSTAAALLCGGVSGAPAAILTGRVLDGSGTAPVPLAELRATWTVADGAEPTGRSVWSEGIAGTDGRYIFCDLPTETSVSLALRADSASWREAGSVTLPAGRVVGQDLQAGADALAVVRGSVVALGDGSPLVDADVHVLAVVGDTIGRARTDAAGAFQVTVPPGVGYRVVASHEGYWREASEALTLEGAERLDVDFELAPEAADATMAIEGLVVEVEARREATVRRLLGQFGHSPESLGRRWMDRAVLDSIETSGDPGVAIQWHGIPGVWVEEGAKIGEGAQLCVTHMAADICAMIMLNGARIDASTALTIDFKTLESIAVLSPEDATTFYGTMAQGGAVLLWTRIR